MRSTFIGICAAASVVAAGYGIAAAGPSGASGSASDTVTAKAAPEPFEKAVLRVEINATDGDAGLQIDADHEPWARVMLTAPDGRRLVDVTNRGVLKGYGLTELFSESSEPPFTTFPLSKFKQLFPEGRYVFTGRTIDGSRMRSTYDLTHDFPSGPRVTSPVEGSTVSARDVVVQWRPGPSRPGVHIVRYQVLVVDERGNERTLAADLSGDARRFPVAPVFVKKPGEYKIEVLAIERSGNQTLTELPFEVR